MTRLVLGSTPDCSVSGCGSKAHGKGLCNLHYKRMQIHGDTSVRLTREAGAGTPHIDGYWVLKINGKSKLRHIHVAETALGRSLPHGAIVHHADEDRSNDAATNLVICPDRGYHKILHGRINALRECGNVNWILCWLCKKYDEPSYLIRAGGSHQHPACGREYSNRKYAERKTGAV